MSDSQKAKQRVRKKPKSFLKRVWNNIKIRCTNNEASTATYYFGMEFCNKDEFINHFLKDPIFLKLHSDWGSYGYSFEKTPSIDRIDSTKGYQLNNLQFMHLDKNCGKDKEKLPILMFDLSGNFIKEFESKWAAHKELGIPNGNICKVVYGKRKSAGGYVFKFKP